MKKDLIKKTKKEKKFIKRGFCQFSGRQRWLNKETGKVVFRGPKKEDKHKEGKELSVKLAKEGMGLRAIGRIVGFSHVTIYRWLNSYCETLSKPTLPDSCKYIKLDEIWHFLQKKEKKAGLHSC